MTGTALILLALLIAAIAMLPVVIAYLRRGRRAMPGAPLITLTVVALVGIGALVWGQYSWRQGDRMIDPLAEHARNPEQSVGDLARSFEHRLSEAPAKATVENLVLLARSFEASGNHARAARSYAQANVSSGFENPDLLVAEAQAHLRDPQLSEQTLAVARERASQALALAPMHPGAHYVAGDLALREGALAAAIEHFEVVYQADILAPGAQSALGSRLQEWRARTDGGDMREAPEAGIQVQVDAAAVAVPAGATLFVYARVPDGPPMPIAARRVEPVTFPLSITLSDRDRLRAGPSLLAYETLEVGARLSTTGEAGGAPGDPSAVARIAPAGSASATLRLRN